MTHPPASRLAGYHSPDLPPEDRLALDDHLATCAACREQLLDPARLRGGVAHLRRELTGNAGLSLSWRRASWAAALLAAAAATGAWAILREPARLRSLEPAAVAGVLALDDADGPVRLRSDGRIEGLGALSPALESRLRDALQTAQVRVGSSSAGLPAGRGRLRSSEERPLFRLIGPAGIVVESDRPVFRWERLPGAVRYVVTVYDLGYREVARSVPVKETEWQPVRPLPREATYSWQVTAIKERKGGQVTVPQPPEPEARFTILDSAQAEELARTRASTRSHLLLGVRYAQAGMVDEAQAELVALRALNPGSALVRALLDSLRRAGPESSAVTGHPTR